MKGREKARVLVRDYTESLAIAVVLALIIRFFVLTAYKIPTTSMWPTLRMGDFVFAYRLPFGLRFPFIEDKFLSFSSPNRGDVVVFRYSDDSINYIKRVVAIPGDRIELKKKHLIINGAMAKYTESLIQNDLGDSQQFLVLRESILDSDRTVTLSKFDQKDDYGPEVVPPGFIFVMGDNRDSSDDSRYWGMIPIKNVDGRVFAIWLSLDWQSQPGGFPSIRWNRLLAKVN